jgi:DNA-binding CsgD family transcriptional regulator
LNTFVPDLVEALVLLGRVDDAAAHVATLEERGKALGSPWASATGARCRGLVAAAGGDFAEALASLDRALVAHERLPQPFELARTHLIHGTVLRRAKRRGDARAALSRAIAIFDELPARLWATRAREEVARIGGRTSVGGELTKAERRVAELAAVGRTNREVAEALFVTERTVEAALTRAYRKLGVRSRTELARKL